MYEYLIKRFKKKFLKALEKASGFSVKTDIKHEFDRIFAENTDLIEDPPSRLNIVMTSWVLAAYVVLKKKTDQQTAMAIIRNAFIEPDKKMVHFLTKAALWFSRNPLRTMAKISKDKEVNAYGKTFYFERVQDTDKAYFLDVKKCLYNDFFRKNGAPELTAIFCDFDMNWAEVIDPKKHGMKFERPGTLGYGQGKCQFQFSAVSKSNHREAL